MTDFPRCTVTIARDGDEYVVTRHAGWRVGDDPSCFRSNDPRKALEIVEAFVCPGGWVVETFEDDDGNVWSKQPRPV